MADNTREKSRKARFKYEFENLMLKGIWSRFALLFTIIVISILFFAFVMMKMNPETYPTYSEALWASYLRIVHPGMITGANGTLPYMIVMYIMTIIGVLFSGSTISIITTSMAKRIDSLSKGETKVEEKEAHTVILGYNEITKTILEELAAMYHHTGTNTAIVVMDDKMSAADMTSEINRRIKDFDAKIICRYGSIVNMNDLDVVSLEDCDTIIISAKDDFEAVEAILACTGKLKKFEAEGISRDNVYINAVIHDKKNILEARIAGGDRLKVICYEQVMAKIIAGSGREPGVSYVYRELMDYVRQGIFYVTKDKVIGNNAIPSGTGTFAMNRYLDNALAIGGVPIEKEANQFDEVDDISNNRYLFATAASGKVDEYEAFFMVKDSEAQMKLLSSGVHPAVDESIIAPSDQERTARPIKMLILGNNPMVHEILREENEYFAHTGTVIDVIVADTSESVKEYIDPASEEANYPSLNITAEVCNVMDYTVLRELVESSNAKNVIVLEDPSLDQRKADERMLSQLIYLQKIRENYNSRNNDFNITCQVSLENTRELADLTGANDFVVGNSMTAFILTQITLYPELYEIIHELLSSSSVGIYMRPMTDYINFGGRGKMDVDIYTLTAAAAKRREVFLGLHRLAFNKDTGEMYYQVPEINPVKWDGDDRTNPKKYAVWAEDEAVVISTGA